MEIRCTKKDNELEMALEGRLDTISAPGFEKTLNDNLNGVTKVVFDLKGLDYISSAGLRVLLAAANTLGEDNRITVRNTNVDVREVFDVTGYSDMFIME